jgi:dipeptidyl aminopeptidase/acylaminoacyl peptidase
MMSKHSFVWLWTIVLSIGVLYGQKAAFTPEALWSLGRVSLQDVSPDGKQVLYTVTNYDLPANKGNTTLYMVTPGSGSPQVRQLTELTGSVGNARFRPDGRRIGYLVGGLMWEMNPDGTGKVQVGKAPVGGFCYSPKGDYIAFIRDVKYRKTVQDIYPDLPHAKGRIIDDLMYRHWNYWDDFHDPNVFIQSYKDGQLLGEARNIVAAAVQAPVEPFDGIEEVVWHPDGRRLVYSAKREAGKAFALGTNTDLFLYDLDKQSTTNLTEGMPGYDKHAVFSPDGRRLAWLSMATPGYEADKNRLFVYDFQTGTKEDISRDYDESIDAVQWASGGQELYFTAGVDATKQLFSIAPATRRIRQITKGQWDIGSFLVSAQTLTAVRTDMNTPAELYRIDLPTGGMSQLTFTNRERLSGYEGISVKKRMVKTTDGQNMHVWVAYPPNFDATKKYPALLLCQGGPQSLVSQSFSYRWNVRLMASQGYIVVAPCRRGMPGFGTEWNRQISGDWGGQAMQDLLSAIDDVQQEPYVDADRLGAVGASYGGFSVYWLAGNHNKRFKAFISHCGTYNLESWYATTEELFFANHDMGGAPWDEPKPASYTQFSPHLFVKQWDTPILVIHNEKDFRVPIGEGLQAFQAAQLLGVPSRFLYLPDEGHWVVSPQTSLLWQRVFSDWLDKWLK